MVNVDLRHKRKDNVSAFEHLGDITHGTKSLPVPVLVSTIKNIGSTIEYLQSVDNNKMIIQ